MISRIPVDPKGLVVDDDSNVRMFAVAVLDQEGYDVVSAANRVEALRAVQQAKSEFDFLVTDYDLGTSNGLALAAAVRQVFPAIRVLVISGSGVPWPVITAAADDFLLKPFTGMALCDKVRRLLGKSDGQPAMYARRHAMGDR